MAQNVKYLDAGVYMIHVLTLNVGTAASPVFQETFAIPLMQRRTGALFALPMGAIPDPLLQAGMTASPEDLIGPSTTVTVPVVLEEVDGTEAPTDQDMDVMIVDFHIAVLESVRGFDPVTEGPGIQLFSPSGPDVLPESSSLLLAAYSWLEEGAEGRTQFYSAEEPPPASAAPAKSNPAGRGKTKASPGGASTPKRVTTATLAEQLAELSKNLPAISTRLDAMAERQNKVEALLSAGTAQQSAPTPAYRQNFERPSALRKASPLQFMQDIGSPPRVRALQDKAKPTAVTTMEEDEPELLPCDPDFQVVEASKGDLSAGMPEAIMRQSQALTTLVAHLVGQDSLQDFPSAASSSVLSLKGSAKRDKLLSDLSLRKGNFLLKVAQNAFRRLKPTDPLPRSLEEFGGKTIFSKYLERNGGYAGQKDLGLVMWLLCQIADTMIQGDQQGAQELLALTMVTIEQTALDGGKWEVGWMLSLQEDPPPGVFNSRPTSTNPRLRAFGPLCPPEWATIALSFVKEIDIINNRRQEAIPSRGTVPKDHPQTADNPKKRQPKFPKKPKQGGDQAS